MKGPGLMFGLNIGHGIEESINYAVIAEKYGFDSIWSDDHILVTNPEVGIKPGTCVPEVWTRLAAIGMRTQLVKLVCAVTDPLRRHPAQTAQALATLDRLTGGRAILGIGAGEAMNLYPFGIDSRLSLQRLRESVEVIKRLLISSSKSPVTYKGRFYQLRGAFLQINPVQKPRPPIYIGALGPRNRELTGEIADGWCGWLQTPEILREYIQDIRKGAERVGRSLDEIDIASLLPTAISTNREEYRHAIDEVKKDLVLERNALEKMGYPTPFKGDLAIQYLIPSLDSWRRLLEARASIPDSAVERVSAFGEVDDCIERIETLKEAGIKHIVIANYGPDYKRTLEHFKEKIIPYFKEIK